MIVQEQQEQQMEFETYRQFVQLRRGQMGELFPLMKASEMEDRILQEWQSISETQKHQLMENLRGNGHVSGVKREPTPLKGAKRVMQQSTKAKAQPHQNAAAEAKKEFKNMPTKSLFVNKAQHVPQAEPNQDQPMPEASPVSKGENYIAFYKFCYDKLSREHKRWSSSQVAAVVRLIWKKRKAHRKQRELIKKATAHKIIKKTVTGKVAFKHAKLQEGRSNSEIMELWKRLPIESRKMWGQTGRGDEPKLSNPMAKKKEVTSKMNFMFKQM